MHLHSYRLRNFKRLKDAHIELASDISIFVGSNNSGKTSATQALQNFVSASKDRFSLYDFSSTTWKTFDEAGELDEVGLASGEIVIPSIDLDLWFDVSANDLYLVIPLLPSTAWQGTKVGIRVSFAARNPAQLIRTYQAAKAKGLELAGDLPAGADYVPWPKSLTDFLQRELRNEFEFKYYILNRTNFDDNFMEIGYYVPDLLEGDPGGGTILKSLLLVDNLGAQRHLADPSSEGGGRAEDLSKRLSRFYKRNLDQQQDDHRALKALADSEKALNVHLDGVFKPTLDRLAKLGYPGLNNPELRIMSALDPSHVMNQDAKVHYVMGEGEDAVTLPDSNNGLGYKNLIYMVVEILDAQAKWQAIKDNRPPLHLIFVEEPEAHLHAQLQQVFIRNVLELMKLEDDDDSIFSSQMVITTHSPHILYERGFRPIRYFRRRKSGTAQLTEVLNLSAFYVAQPNDRDFLQKYLKLTHCDLFFSDAAILVEGNVERLLLPLMIEKVAKPLRSSCLCILEVGGAFGHRFQSLIEFLGLTTLIITDIDSVSLIAPQNEGQQPSEVDDDEIEEFEVPSDEVADIDSENEGQQPSDATNSEIEEIEVLGDEVADGGADAEAQTAPAMKKKYGKACVPSEAGAATSNQTLIKWLPRKHSIDELQTATDDDKTHDMDDGAKVRVAYQMRRAVTWNGATEHLCGRTLEEDFGLENPTWSQAPDRKQIGLVLRTTPETPTALADALHKRVSGKTFDKTKFALGVMTEDIVSWTVPTYITDGLVWLKERVAVEDDGLQNELTVGAADVAVEIASE